MLRLAKTQFNSLPSIVTAIMVGVFVSWFVAQAVIEVPSKGDISLPPPPPPSSVTATPSSGTAPLNGVDVAVDAGGSSGDTFIYKFNCVNGDGSYDWTYPSSGSTVTNPYFKADLCNYANAGTYTVLADITRYHTTANGSTAVTNYAFTTNVTVSAPPPPPPSIDIKANNSDDPVQISVGSSTTLSWIGQNTTGCIASTVSGNDSSWPGPNPARAYGSGSQSTKVFQFSPDSVTYKLTCTGSSGASVSDQVTVGTTPSSGGSVSAEWMNPTANPPGGNVPPPVDTGENTQTKNGGLTLGALDAASATIHGAAMISGNVSVNGSSNLISSVTAGNLALNSANSYANALLVPYGKVGIGTLAPDATLEVKGTVKMFGVPQSRSFNTTYTAPTDGFVKAWIRALNSTERCSIEGISSTVDASGNPVFVQMGADAHYDIESSNVSYRTYVQENSILLPVFKGRTWQVTFSNGSGSCQNSIQFIPLGS